MRKLVTYLVLIFTLIAVHVPVYASENLFQFDPGKTLKDATGLGDKDPAYIVFTTINTALIFLGSITVVIFIIAGFMWILAGGEEEKINDAKDLIKGAVFGLVIVLGAYGLAQFVFAAIRIATTGS